MYHTQKVIPIKKRKKLMEEDNYQGRGYSSRRRKGKRSYHCDSSKPTTTRNN